ncbi:MAG: heme/copper-type cytochrome/quinol oxidase, subunit 2 [Verrucomicrobiaceae bacterium]|nr:heme/copper-type cytochrome/quinol oxidase, subunit 2 [Verrucomicrobiaceae bacterium]
MCSSSISWSFCLLLLSLEIGAAHAGEAGSKQQRAALYENGCARCHGPQGQGSESLSIPSIAGQPAWYVLRQLDNFREDRRGTDSGLPQAVIMAAMVKVLAREHREGVAAFVESLVPVSPPVGTVKAADLAEGKTLFEERCMECHRYNGSGELTFGSSPLTGLQDWYLKAQIRNFKNGRRGALPGDVFGAKMVFSAQFIESEEALQSVAAYIVSLNGVPKPTDDADALFKLPADK